MRPHPTHHESWIDLVSLPIPAGREGYRKPTHHRPTEGAVRSTLADRLAHARLRLEQAIARCRERDAWNNGDGNNPFEPEGHRLLTEIVALERVRGHLDRIAARCSTSAMALSEALHLHDVELRGPHARAHAHAHGMIERAERMLRRFEEPDTRHDFLAELEADLAELERMYDEWSAMLAEPPEPLPFVLGEEEAA